MIQEVVPSYADLLKANAELEKENNYLLAENTQLMKKDDPSPFDRSTPGKFLVADLPVWMSDKPNSTTPLSRAEADELLGKIIEAWNDYEKRMRELLKGIRRRKG